MSLLPGNLWIGERYLSARFALIYTVSVVVISHLISFVVPGKILLPILGSLGAYWIFAAPLRKGDYMGAVRMAILWALVTSLVQIMLSRWAPNFMETQILRGAEYRDEMFRWVTTGEGPEGNIALFLPIHVRHFIIFCLLSLLSGGYLGLMMGAVLLGYMNYYVGSLIAACDGSSVASLMGWSVWAILRVVGYIVAGTALGSILVKKGGTLMEKFMNIRGLMLWALILVVMDVIVKWQLAAYYQSTLNRVFGG